MITTDEETARSIKPADGESGVRTWALVLSRIALLTTTEEVAVISKPANNAPRYELVERHSIVMAVMITTKKQQKYRNC
jgi:hypothetical protein